MDNEKVVVLQLKLTQRRCLFALAFAFLCFHPRPLGSETLNLSTYYPAPYGGYVAILTTGQGGINTLLARDGGSVGIGTAAPGAKLDVNGNTTVRADLTVGHDATIGHNEDVGVDLTVHGNTYLRTNLDVSGTTHLRSSLTVDGNSTLQNTWVRDLHVSGTIYGVCHQTGGSCGSGEMMVGGVTTNSIGATCGSLLVSNGIQNGGSWTKVCVNTIGAGARATCCRFQ